MATKHQEFNVGDRVVLNQDYGSRDKGDVGTVVSVKAVDIEEFGVSATQLVHVDYDKSKQRYNGGAFNFRFNLEPVSKTFRIECNGSIGKTEYDSIEATKEAAKLHGLDAEEFSIWEVKKIASLKVQVTKDLVEI